MQRNGDVLSIDTQDDFGMFNAIKQGVETWIDQINSGKKLKKDLKDQLVANFHSLKITDVRKITNPSFLRYIANHLNVTTHPHLKKAARIQLIRLE